jgi:hypothetical protein
MMSEALRKDALTAIRALREWVQAVPDDAQLPAMPGIDGDWLDEVEAALAEPESKEQSSERIEQSATVKDGHHDRH